MVERPEAFEERRRRRGRGMRMSRGVGLGRGSRGQGERGSVAEASDSPNHIRNYWAWHKDVFALGVDGWWPDDGDEPDDSEKSTEQTTEKTS